MIPIPLAAAPGSPARPPVNVRVALAAGLALAAGAAFVSHAVSWRQGALALVGAVLGFALYHGSFGFTAAYRRLLVERRGDGVRAQLLMLALAVTLFYPALGEGSLFGLPLRGSVAPLGIGVVVGAFLFGAGMQLGGGCASGTLFSVGGGSTRMLVTLLFFVIGAVLGRVSGPFWGGLPGLGRIDVIEAAGWPLALALHLLAFAVLAAVTLRLERGAHATMAASPVRPHLLRGPWPLAFAAVALALGNFATLALAGRPWGVSSAFSLWGGKTASALGADVGSWPGFDSPAAAAALEASVLRDTASVMDFAIVLGALLASSLAGRFAPRWRFRRGALFASVIGGLLLGYGASIASGCNIGAFFSGVASGSMHGWVWIVAALAGTVAGVRLRPLFGLQG